MHSSSSKEESFKLQNDDDIGSGDPIRTWFLQYI